jgi:Ribosomal L28e protein family
MVYCPEQLLWECVRKNNAFLVKKNGHTKRSGKVAFSSEKGNLKSMHMIKYSGLVNPKAIDIVSTVDNKTSLFKKTASKCDVNPSKSKQVSNIRKDFVRSVKTLNKVAVDNYYRPDLKKELLAKYSVIYNANRRARGILKPVPCKKGRCVYSKK